LTTLLDWVTIDMPPRRYIFAPRQKTQLGMDRLFIKECDLYLAFRVQLAAKFIFICLMFGAAIPVLYLCAALFFAYGTLIDRHNLLRNQTPPPRTSATLTMRAHMTVLPLGIITHGVMAVVCFHHLALDDGRNRLTPPPPTSPPTLPLLQNLPYLVLPPTSPPSPPLSPPFADFIATTTAIYTALALAVCSTFAVAAFGCYHFPPQCCRSLINLSPSVPLSSRIILSSPTAPSGPLLTPSIRPPPREYYLPPTLSVSLLARFHDHYVSLERGLESFAANSPPSEKAAKSTTPNHTAAIEMQSALTGGGLSSAQL